MVTPNSLRDMLSLLRAKHKVASDALAQVEADMNAVERTLALYQDLEAEDSRPSVILVPSFHYDPDDYQGMSQIEAIVSLAKNKGGVVRVADAKQMLIETGKTKSKKPYSIATSIIIRNGHLFEWVSPGTYRLIPYSNNNGNGHVQQPMLGEGDEDGS